MTVSEVALHLGFDDVAYFSRFFKAEIGCAPSEFRARIASGTQGAPPLAPDLNWTR
jgi:AraC family transcriptional activator of pobA